MWPTMCPHSAWPKLRPLVPGQRRLAAQEGGASLAAWREGLWACLAALGGLASSELWIAPLRANLASNGRR